MMTEFCAIARERMSGGGSGLGESGRGRRWEESLATVLKEGETLSRS
jgi:hypothetical protein